MDAPALKLFGLEFKEIAQVGLNMVFFIKFFIALIVSEGPKQMIVRRSKVRRI